MEAIAGSRLLRSPNARLRQHERPTAAGSLSSSSHPASCDRVGGRLSANPEVVGGEQLRPGVRRVGELVAAFADLAVRGEQPVHRALRREAGALVQQRRVHVRGRAVDEPLVVQLLEHRAALGL